MITGLDIRTEIFQDPQEQLQIVFVLILIRVFLNSIKSPENIISRFAKNMKLIRINVNLKEDILK